MENQVRGTGEYRRRGSSGLFSVENALKLCCVGFAAGVVLRVVQMLYCYDYATGFDLDGGVLGYASLGAAVFFSLAACLICLRFRNSFRPYIPRRNPALGGAALLSATVLIVSGLILGADYVRYENTGAAAFDSTTRGPIHVAFVLCCLFFGLVQIVLAAGLFLGRNTMARAPLLYLFAVFWGIAYLMLVYVFYARSSSFVENFFALLGGAMNLLGLFYLCKLFAGVEEGTALRLYLFGIPAVVLNVSYSLANLALMALGKSYTGEIPSVIQVCSLSVSLFLLVFLMTFRKYGVRRAVMAVREGEQPHQPTRGGRRFRPD